jgi:hypothetical protein
MILVISMDSIGLMAPLIMQAKLPIKIYLISGLFNFKTLKKEASFFNIYRRNFRKTIENNFSLDKNYTFFLHSLSKMVSSLSSSN